MKKNVGIYISKCLKSAAKNRRANQTARAILSAPTVYPVLFVLLKMLLNLQEVVFHVIKKTVRNRTVH